MRSIKFLRKVFLLLQDPHKDTQYLEINVPTSRFYQKPFTESKLVLHKYIKLPFNRTEGFFLHFFIPHVTKHVPEKHPYKENQVPILLELHYQTGSKSLFAVQKKSGLLLDCKVSLASSLQHIQPVIKMRIEPRICRV